MKLISSFLTAIGGGSPNDRLSAVVSCIGAIMAAGFLVIAGLGVGYGVYLVPAVFFLLAFASLLIGSFLGLLFGIPERRNDPSPTNPPTASAPNQKTDFRSSDNLKQIADWLTKIIVGVTLTQFDKIVGYLDSAAKFAAACMPPCKGMCEAVSWAHSASFSIMLFYGTAGFWLGYLWAVTNLPKLFTDSERAKKEEEVKDQASSAGALQEPKAAARNWISELSSPGAAAPVIEPGTVPDDPWKGVFGGSNRNDDWELSAKVTPMLSGHEFQVDLTVSSRTSKPVSGDVTLYLHPTFPKMVQTVPLNFKGVARLTLVAWGAFTVGAITPDGAKLELDLSKIDAPKLFRDR